ncbi:restriction endonuclease subunit S [Legionella pneumophila]|uniref:restriction endonuclease subunit S n=1 Tax=Legionella pneumophila TaxID=446 RepID=UPI001020D574|nr:restriction endonuclease subunit S [Legionella pneumophila]RYW83734.1 restriction endonuclease subunit S [Legionella pneumophila]HCD9498751.1 restriction endonuclease subunit S [Legionella pneumophila]
MKSDWSKAKLSDFIKIKHGYAFKGKYITLTPSEYIVLTPGNFKIGGGFNSSKFKYYENSDFPNSYILNDNDLIVTMTDLSKAGDTLGYAAKVPVSSGNIKYLHNQRIGLVELKNDIIKKDYLYWLMRTRKYQNYIVNTATGSTVKHTSPSRILDYECYFPTNINEQKNIVNILTALEDKIELNKKINQTLESIAQAMFKSWFVDFDPVHAKANANSEDEYDAIAKELGISREILDLFPSEFEESELGLIPKGWTVDEIGNAIKTVGGGTPSTKNKDYWDGGDISWSTPKDLSSLSFPVLLDTERKITEQGLKKISSGLLEEGTLLLSSRAPIGYTAISQIPVAINQGFIAIPPNQKLSNIFLLYWINNSLDVIKNYSGGTTFQEISKKNFRLIKLILPGDNILNAFSKSAQNLFDSIVMNEMENKTLVKIRDLLLPKLLSGEIDVSNLNLEPEND